jgi:hypothetical protein
MNIPYCDRALQAEADKWILEWLASFTRVQTEFMASLNILVD